MMNNDILTLVTIVVILCSAIYGFIELDGSFSSCELISSLNVIIFSVILIYFEKYKKNIEEYGFNIHFISFALYSFVGLIVISTSSYGWVFSIFCFLNVIVNIKDYKNIDTKVNTDFSASHEFNTSFNENIENEEDSPNYNIHL